MYKAKICITLRPSILDPQGKAAKHALQELGFTTIDQVRMGKYVEMWLNADTEEDARSDVEEACKKLLANPVMEDYAYTLERQEAAV